MIKALLLILDPMATWEGIFRARRSLASVLVAYLLPMILLASAAEGFGLVHWGKWQGEVGRIKLFPIREAVIVEAAQFLLALVVVFVGANMLKSIGETFHGRHTYTQAFTTVAYGLSPLFLLRLLDAFTGVSPWVSWSIGIILSIAVLYQGVPRMMEPDPPHAFGLFLMSALLLALVSGLVRFLAWWYLRGKFDKLEAIISDLAARLP
jgi:Yip1 domain